MYLVMDSRLTWWVSGDIIGGLKPSRISSRANAKGWVAIAQCFQTTWCIRSKRMLKAVWGKTGDEPMYPILMSLTGSLWQSQKMTSFFSRTPRIKVVNIMRVCMKKRTNLGMCSTYRLYLPGQPFEGGAERLGRDILEWSLCSTWRGMTNHELQFVGGGMHRASGHIGCPNAPHVGIFPFDKLLTSAWRPKGLHLLHHN